MTGSVEDIGEVEAFTIIIGRVSEGDRLLLSGSSEIKPIECGAHEADELPLVVDLRRINYGDSDHIEIVRVDIATSTYYNRPQSTHEYDAGRTEMIRESAHYTLY